MTTSIVLDSLVGEGLLKEYSLEDVDEDGEVGKKSQCRNSEKLTLVFPNGKRLVIDSFCSGCLENTALLFSSQ